MYYETYYMNYKCLDTCLMDRFSQDYCEDMCRYTLSQFENAEFRCFYNCINRGNTYHYCRSLCNYP
jgi:hypothetical protein